MVIQRGGVHWADLGPPRGSRPAKRRPVLVVQSDPYNESRLATVVVAMLTSNLGLAAKRGNIFLPRTETGLPRDSVLNITAVATIDKRELSEPARTLDAMRMAEVDRSLRLVLGL